MTLSLESIYNGFILATICSIVESQILDTSFPIIFEDPQLTTSPLAQRKTYFGYSVVLFSGHNISWIQIGAPRANCTSQERIIEPGRAYRCGIPGPCHYLPIDPSGNEYTSDYYDLKDGGWLGGTQAVHQIGDQVAVCAPRWKNQKRKYDWGIEGACYTAMASDISGQPWSKYLPLLGHDQYTHPTWRKRNVHDYFLGQAGVSANFPQHQEFRGKPLVQLVLGAPGVLNWRGTSILMTQHALPGSVSKREALFLSPSAMDSGFYDSVIIPHMIGIKDIYDADYFGYSVTSGNFFSTDELLHVASAPRGNAYKGKVILYEFPFETRGTPRLRYVLSGIDFGGYFGASLAVADLTGDRLDDLMVTAPQLTKPRVYIFLGSEKRSLLPPQNGPQYLEAGLILGDDSQFGAALSAADLDQDGYSDVLVGAPGAGVDGSGALVIFRGGPDGVISEKPSQVIFAKDVTPQINIIGFGGSLSPPIDVDGNNYPDVAIGAYLSGHVVFLRSRAHAQLSAWLTGPEQLLRNTTSFNINVCMLYSPIRHPVKPIIALERVLAVDAAQNRAFLDVKRQKLSLYVEKRNIELAKENCEILQINIAKNIQNFFDPIEITLNVTVFANSPPSEPTVIAGDNVKGKQGFDKEQPVAAPAVSILSLPFATECGDDGVCNADLRIGASFPDIKETGFVLGSSESVRLQIQLWNLGEPAYLTRVRVKIPQPAAAAKLPPACQVDSPQDLICNVDVALHIDIIKTISLEIDMRNVKGSRLQFSVEALTKSLEVSPENNIINVTLPLVVEAKLQIVGKSMKDTYAYWQSDETHLHELVQFEHIFEVQKSGASPVEDVTISVKIPHKYSLGSRQFTFNRLYQPEGFQSGQPFACEDTDMIYLTDEVRYNDTASNLTSREEVKRVKRSYLENFLPTFEGFGRLKRSVFDEDKVDSGNGISVTGPDGNLDHSFEEDTRELPANRTVRITCEADGVVCHELHCVVGAFRKSQTVARLLITMQINVSALRETIMGDKDIVVLQSQGSAKTTGPNSVGVVNGMLVRVNSVFVSTPPEGRVDYWVILISLIVGMLLFLLVTMGLVKAGFFQRTMKADLEALKEAAAIQQTEDPDAEWVEDVTKDHENDLNLES